MSSDDAYGNITTSALLRAKQRHSFFRLLFESEMNNGGGCENRGYLIKFFQLIVVSVRLVTPICYGFFFYALFFPIDKRYFGGPIPFYIIFLWSLLEVLFLPYYFYLFTVLNHRNEKLPHFAICEESRFKLVKMCFEALVDSAHSEAFHENEDVEDIDIDLHYSEVFPTSLSISQKYMRKLLEGWFLDVPLHEIHRENVIEWLSWAFFDRFIEELSQHELIECDRMLEYIEHLMGNYKFPPGRSEHLMSATLTLDPVFATQRPLIFYTCMRGMDFLAKQRLHFGYGFRKLDDFSCDSQVIYYRPPRNDSYWIESEALPLVFIHGIGMGLSQYLDIVSLLSKDVPCFLVEWPHVGMQMSTPHDILTAEQSVDRIAKVFEYFNLTRRGGCFVCHSLGTTMVSWLTRLERGKHLVSATVILDPISFVLCHPKVATAFVYKDPRSPIEFLMHFFLSRELFIANYLSRHFSWSHNIMFVENLTECSQLYAERCKKQSRSSSNLSVRVEEEDVHNGYGYFIRHDVSPSPLRSHRSFEEDDIASRYHRYQYFDRDSSRSSSSSFNIFGSDDTNRNTSLGSRNSMTSPSSSGDLASDAESKEETIIEWMSRIMHGKKKASLKKKNSSTRLFSGDFDVNEYRIIHGSDERKLRHTIVMSKDDFIVPTSSALRYLRKKSLEGHDTYEVLLFDGGHGGFTLSKKWLRILKEKIDLRAGIKPFN